MVLYLYFHRSFHFPQLKLILETDWNHWTTEDVAKNAQLSDEGLEVLKKEKIRGAHLDQLQVSQLPSLPLGDKMNLTNLITKHKKNSPQAKFPSPKKRRDFLNLMTV